MVGSSSTKQIRVIDKCPGKDEAALHAPGELIDGCSTLLGERHKLKQVLYPFFCLFRRDVEIPGIGEQVTCTREIRVEVGLLRSYTDPLFDFGRVLVGIHTENQERS